jgi:hypothetical protein
MVSQDFCELLEIKVTDYFSMIWQTPDAKREPIELSITLPATGTLAGCLRKLARRDRDAFGGFAFAKHALALVSRADCWIEVRNLIPEWLSSCVEVGSYEDCVEMADACKSSAAWRGDIPARTRLSILLSRAKSLRNLGKFNDAQETYRELINLADDLGDGIGVSMGLVLIGKLYGNYLGQRSLFSSFVEEARRRLEEERRAFNGPATEYNRIIRWLAICYDTLGQAYRLNEPSDINKQFMKERDEVERQFKMALELNRVIKRRSGVSRATCHLNYFKFRYAARAENSETYLDEFKKGMKLLMGRRPDERGLGIRFIQYASMLHKLNRQEEAQQYLEAGKNFATRYSDHKTVSRAAIIESQLYGQTDPERGLEVLKQARMIALRYELPIQESEINRHLAELSSGRYSATQSDPDLQPHKVFNRNRAIHVKLISEVKSNFLQLEQVSNTKPEFKRLSSRAKNSFRRNLWVDFDNAVNQLDLNIQALTAELSINTRQRQELVVFDVLNSVALLLLHDYKATILDDTKITPLREASQKLNELAMHLNRAVEMLGIGSKEREYIEQIIVSLEGEAVRTHALAMELAQLKERLSERLRQPDLDNLDEQISMVEACNKAIDELQEQNTKVKELVDFRPACDLRLHFNGDIMVRVIQNLIRNALDELYKEFRHGDKIVVSLGAESSSADPSLRNTSEEAVLCVITFLQDEGRARKVAASIKRGLDKPTTDKRYGWGVGLRLAKLVFREFFGAEIGVYLDKSSAGIRASFLLDPPSIEVAPI